MMMSRKMCLDMGGELVGTRVWHSILQVWRLFPLRHPLHLHLHHRQHPHQLQEQFLLPQLRRCCVQQCFVSLCFSFYFCRCLPVWTPLSLSLPLPVFLCLCPSLVCVCVSFCMCVSVCLSVWPLSLISLFLCLWLSSVSLPIFLSVSACLPVCLSVCLPVSLFLCLSVCLSLGLSVCLSCWIMPWAKHSFAWNINLIHCWPPVLSDMIQTHERSERKLILIRQDKARANCSVKKPFSSNEQMIHQRMMRRMK